MAMSVQCHVTLGLSHDLGTVSHDLDTVSHDLGIVSCDNGM